MFYSYDLLCQRAGGKFSLIWLAATHKRLSNNECSRINISKTCKEIMEVIKNQEPRENTTKNQRTRFSLYLSSMLLYGVCIVYRNQVAFVIDHMRLWCRLVTACSEAQPTLQDSGEDEATDLAAIGKKCRKRKKKEVLPHLTDKQLKELEAPLTNVPAGMVSAASLPPQAQLPFLPPDIPETSLIPQMDHNDKETDVPMDQICDELNKRFASREIDSLNTLTTEKKFPEGNQLKEHIEEMISEPHVPLEKVPEVQTEIHEIIHVPENPEVSDKNQESVSAPPIKDLQLVEVAQSECIPENTKPDEDAIKSNLDSSKMALMAFDKNVTEEPQGDHDKYASVGQLSSKFAEGQRPEIPVTRNRRRQNSQQLSAPSRPPKKKKIMVYEDGETEIDKNTLKQLFRKKDVELKDMRIQEGNIQYSKYFDVKYLFENPCYSDFPLINKLQAKFEQMQFQHQMSHISDENIEIQRGQRTPTTPESPLQRNRSEESSILHREVSDQTSKLEPIVETKFEEIDVPVNVSNIVTEVPLLEIPIIDIEQTEVIPEQSVTREDSNALVQPPFITETCAQENTFSVLPEQIELTDAAEELEIISKQLKETSNLLKWLKTLECRKIGMLTFTDLCPPKTTTKYRAAVTLKQLLELDFKKQIVLQQEQSVPFDHICVKVL